jgi:hypothetical protein
MRINEDKTTYKPPFTVILLDAMDAYYYADVMDKMEEVAKEADLDKAIALADALFVEKNKGWESLQAMNDVDGGYDVRVYDSEFSCVYAAHTKYIENWIDKTPAVMTPVDHEKTYKEFQERFTAMSDEELVEAFNREVGNPGWTSSRATYLALLREEFEKRKFDHSAVTGSGGLSLKQKVKLVDGKLVVEEDFQTMLESVVKDIPGAKIVATTQHYHRTLLASGEPDVADASKPFRVLCDDMFHYQDTDARLFIGSFATREEAVEKCQAILMETLLNLYDPGMTESELMTKWWSFGDDPFVSGPNNSPDDIPFSAAKEAPAFAKYIVEQKEKELTDNKKDI